MEKTMGWGKVIWRAITQYDHDENAEENGFITYFGDRYQHSVWFHRYDWAIPFSVRGNKASYYDEDTYYGLKGEVYDPWRFEFQVGPFAVYLSGVSATDRRQFDGVKFPGETRVRDVTVPATHT